MRGRRNTIADVPGVQVGHVTLREGDVRTGVTVILPAAGENPFLRKFVAASYVLNGFGKSQGLIQVDELGQLETPIALTNTLNVGKVHDALVEYMLERCAADGVALRSVNPIVMECNDARLNDIGRRAVQAAHVREAIAAAGEDFAQGDVGAGAGMICHGFKGGIGSASRLLRFDGSEYALGVLVLTNHGRKADLRIDGRLVCPPTPQKRVEEPDVGSVISIFATNLPLNERQLGRAIRRAGPGLARLGAWIGHGSGEIMLGFSTANRIDANAPRAIESIARFDENRMDAVFRAVADAEEEAALCSMRYARGARALDGTWIESLTEVTGPDVD